MLRIWQSLLVYGEPLVKVFPSVSESIRHDKPLKWEGSLDLAVDSTLLLRVEHGFEGG
jgi:hypothetical protein